MSALLVGTGGVGAVAMQAHAQDGQNTVTTAVDTTATVSAKPSIHGINVDDDDSIDFYTSVGIHTDNEQGDQNEQNEQGDKGGQDSEIDD